MKKGKFVFRIFLGYDIKCDLAKKYHNYDTNKIFIEKDLGNYTSSSKLFDDIIEDIFENTTFELNDVEKLCIRNKNQEKILYDEKHVENLTILKYSDDIENFKNKYSHSYPDPKSSLVLLNWFDLTYKDE